MIEALINGVSVFLGALAGGIIVAEYTMRRMRGMVKKAILDLEAGIVKDALQELIRNVTCK